jgi:hypothetical protein
MMIVYPGDLRVFHLSRCSEVFLPASEAEIECYDRAYLRELPRRITPTLEVLDEAFPSVAEACRRAGIMKPSARIGIALGEYEDEPDAVIDEICKLLGAFDLKLSFARGSELERFLQAHEALLTAAPEPAL